MPSMRSIGLHRLADDAPRALSTSRRRSADSARLRREHVVRLVHQAQRPRPRSRARTRDASDRILSASASASAWARTAAPRSALAVLLGLGGDWSAAAPRARPPARRRSARSPCLPLGHLGLARGEHLLLRRHRLGARRVGRRLRLGLRLALAARPRSRAAARPARAPCGARSRPPAIVALLADALLLDASARSGCAPRRSPARAVICALSAVLLALARSRASSARWRGARDLDLALLRQPRVLALAVDLERRASRPRGSCCGSAISVSCSMSLRCFLRRSICSVSRVRPSASKALVGLKNSMPVWSSWVSDTDFELEAVLAGPPATASRTRLT